MYIFIQAKTIIDKYGDKPFSKKAVLKIIFSTYAKLNSLRVSFVNKKLIVFINIERNCL